MKVNTKGIAIAELKRQREQLLDEADAITRVIVSLGGNGDDEPKHRRRRSGNHGMEAAHAALAAKRAAKKAAEAENEHVAKGASLAEAAAE
jgi:hypothetical protein